MVRKLLVAAVGFLALIVSPFYGCSRVGGGGDRRELRFSDVEMRAAVEGTWEIRLLENGAPKGTITIQVAQAGGARRTSDRGGWIQEAAACSHHTFVKSAEACLDSATMPLEIEVIAGATTAERPTGTFEVEGTEFLDGTLAVEIGDLHLRALVTADGKVTGTVLVEGASVSSVELAKIAS
jgi:hypothetical protein